MGVAGSNWSQQIQFGQDAPHRKDIYRRVIVFGTKEELWRSVPPRTHIFSERRPRSYFTDEAEVSQFDNLLVVDKQVFRLEVSMEEAALVTSIDPLQAVVGH